MGTDNKQKKSMPDIARDHFLESARIKKMVADSCLVEVVAAAEAIVDTLKTGGKVMFCGNGGSAADCQHIATEFTSVLSQDFVRPAMSALALTTDTSFITANANDFGFEGIFERQVEALGKRGDILVGISTSGNSANVVKAFEYATATGIRTIAMTGESGGVLSKAADITIRVPTNDTQIIQESHISIGHVLCELAETAINS